MEEAKATHLSKTVNCRGESDVGPRNARIGIWFVFGPEKDGGFRNICLGLRYERSTRRRRMVEAKKQEPIRRPIHP